MAEEYKGDIGLYLSGQQVKVPSCGVFITQPKIKDIVLRSSENEFMTAYNELIKGYSVGRLKKEGYIRTVPRLDLKEHEDIKSYIIIMMDDFTPTSNDKYRDCTITFFVFSEYDYAEMDNYEYRPIKIAGYIDGVMRDAKLAGIGKLQFLGAQQVPLNEYWGGVALMYVTTHGEEEDSNPDINEAS